MGAGANANRNRAVVIGGGMAGLLATRVLSDHYQDVIVIERDRFPPAGEHRRGVPQGRHTHGLLDGGRQVLEALFPGISDRLVKAGALRGDIAGDCRWFHEGGCLARFRSGLDGVALTRPLLEGVIREEVRKLRNVQIRENCHVEGLTATSDNSRVTGIRLGAEVLSADIVIDATGRGSHSPRWLEALGYQKPQEERVEVALAYTTRFFRRRPQQLNGDIAVIIPPTPAGKRGGVMLAQEGDRWTVTLITHFSTAAPGDLAGFIEFTRTLPAPYIHEVVRESEPVGEPAFARFPASVRSHYEKLKRFPDCYLVFGDAISSFNPIYGQGMSVAAFQATELEAALSEKTGNLAQNFFRRAARVVDIPWSIAANNDLRMPEAMGRRDAGVKFINWYMARLNRAAHHDPVLAMAFHKVANLLAPPATVLRPAIVFRVLRGNLGSRSNTITPDQLFPASAR